MYQKIIDAMADLEDDLLMEEVEAAWKNGTPASEIIAALQKGLDIVGERFAAQEYFLSELMMSADLFNEASEIFRGDEDSENAADTLGTFVIGTVETDIHDIGKNIVASVMKSNGFKVIDLGVDVPVQTFVDAVRKYQPQVIGMSCLLTTCFDYMKKTIEAIRGEGLDKDRLILIGGGPVDDKTVEYVNADARCETAQVTVIKAKEFLGVV